MRINQGFVVELVSFVVDFVRIVDNGYDLGVVYVKKGGVIGRRDDIDDSMQVVYFGRMMIIKVEVFGRYEFCGYGEGELIKGG